MLTASIAAGSFALLALFGVLMHQIGVASKATNCAHGPLLEISSDLENAFPSTPSATAEKPLSFSFSTPEIHDGGSQAIVLVSSASPGKSIQLALDLAGELMSKLATAGIKVNEPGLSHELEVVFNNDRLCVQLRIETYLIPGELAAALQSAGFTEGLPKTLAN